MKNVVYENGQRFYKREIFKKMMIKIKEIIVERLRNERNNSN